jgi:type IX secretion system PorP/SprF family membrane protein
MIERRILHLYILSFVAFVSSIKAQQLSYYTQFRNAQSILNPASVNSDYFLYEYNTSIQATYRGQWVENPETPRHALLSGEYITNMQGERAFELLTGGHIVQDQIGPFSTTGYYGRLGGLFTEDPYFGAFSVGMSIGALQYQVRADRLKWADPGDLNVPEQNVNRTTLDIGIGAFYYKRLQGGNVDGDNIYAGFSVPQLLGNDVGFKTLEPRQVRFLQAQHFYLTGGWYHFINDEAFLEVSAWAKHTKGVPFNLSLIGRFQPKRTVWFGGGFNINGMTHLEIGVNIPNMLFQDSNMKIAYAIDYNIAAFGLPLGTSHEVTLAYMFDVRR